MRLGSGHCLGLRILFVWLFQYFGYGAECRLASWKWRLIETVDGYHKEASLLLRLPLDLVRGFQKYG